MAGPILQSDTKVAWASRINSSAFTRAERINSTSFATSPDTRSPRIVLPPAEHRFADSSPSPFPTSCSVLGHGPHDKFPLPAPESVTPPASGGHEGPFDVDGMYIPGMTNDEDDLQTPNRETMSAPAELHQLHRRITMDTPATKLSADVDSGCHEYRVPVMLPSPRIRTTVSAPTLRSRRRQSTRSQRTTSRGPSSFMQIRC